MPGIQGYSIELAHKGGDTGIRTRQNRMHRKARTGGRCINISFETHISNSPDVDWASILLGVCSDAYGLLALGAGHAPEMYGNGKGTALMNNRDKGGLDMIETGRTAPVKGAIQGRRALPDIWINMKRGR